MCERESNGEGNATINHSIARGRASERWRSVESHKTQQLTIRERERKRMVTATMATARNNYLREREREKGDGNNGDVKK